MSDEHTNSPNLIRKTPSGVFITASDTGAGKTFVARLIVRTLRNQGLRVGAYKPVASGVDTVDDSDPYLLWKETDGNVPFSAVCPQIFREPLAPCLAAEREGMTVNESKLFSGYQIIRDAYELVIVEGAGGLMSPLSWKVSNAKLAQELQLPLLVVVPNRLGAVNQSLLTIAAAKQFGLEVQWLVLNAISRDQEAAFQDHRRMIEQLLSDLKPRVYPKILNVEFDAKDPIELFEAANRQGI